jgi:hypothetical protein
MNRWMLSVFAVGACLLAASRASACDVAGVAVAPQVCAVPAVATTVAIAPQVFVAPQVAVSPLVALTPSVAVVPSVVTTQVVPFRVRPLAVRVRVAPRFIGSRLPRRVFF